ncbi:MAG: ATP-dependent sacrificial sulfur transferase LarE [Longimicrobiales bacterium]
MTEPLPILDPHAASGEEAVPDTARNKLRQLRETLRPLVRDGALVAFSGGMDSAFLLWAAREAGGRDGTGRTVALTTTSPSTPARDKEDAEAFTRDLGIPHVWRESRELTLPAYVRNDRERCYHCKAELFRIAGELAREEGLKWLLYGYNASDRGDIRPGHRAAGEAGALSPLADVGLTKAEIRFLMEEAGLSLAAKPASPCLSSRIMTGIQVTPERLEDVEAMEGILREAGISQLRVRVCREEGGALFLRVEVAPEELEKVLECRRELHVTGRARGYRWVTLDLGGYRTGGGVS